MRVYRRCTHAWRLFSVIHFINNNSLSFGVDNTLRIHPYFPPPWTVEIYQLLIYLTNPFDPSYSLLLPLTFTLSSVVPSLIIIRSTVTRKVSSTRLFTQFTPFATIVLVPHTSFTGNSRSFAIVCDTARILNKAMNKSKHKHQITPIASITH